MASSSSLAIVRWVLLALSVVALLGATVLFRPLYAATVRPWLRLNERALGGRPPELPPALARVVRDGRLLRAWQLLWAVLFLAAWWYLGTTAGARAWAGFAARGS